MIQQLLLILSFAASPTAAFQINNANPPPPNLPILTTPAISSSEQECTRRLIMQRTAAAGAGFLATVVSAADPAGADVIRSPGKCANGEGEGCDSLAENNPLVRRLQKQSSDNREANERVNNNNGNVKGDFGLVGWAAVAVILNDLTSSYLEKRNEQK